MTKHVMVGLGIIGALVFVGGCKSPDMAGADAEVHAVSTNSQPERTKGPVNGPVLLAHLQAEIYEVRATDSGLAAGSKALAKHAGRPEQMLRKLGTFGKVRVLYRFDQEVNVFNETLSIGSNEPVVTGVRKDVRGEQINAIRYQNVGAILKVTGRNPSGEAKRKVPDVTVSIELAALAEGDVELAPGLKASSTASFTLDHTGQLNMGRPIVLVTASSASGPATVYIVRYVFAK